MITFNWPDGTWTRARIRVSRDGTIHFSDVQGLRRTRLSPRALVSWPNPWVRIGNLPT